MKTKSFNFNFQSIEGIPCIPISDVFRIIQKISKRILPTSRFANHGHFIRITTPMRVWDIHLSKDVIVDSPRVIKPNLVWPSDIELSLVWTEFQTHIIAAGIQGFVLEQSSMGPFLSEMNIEEDVDIIGKRCGPADDRLRQDMFPKPSSWPPERYQAEIIDGDWYVIIPVSRSAKQKIKREIQDAVDDGHFVFNGEVWFVKDPTSKCKFYEMRYGWKWKVLE